MSVAQYNGRCPACDDRIIADVDEIVHEDGVGFVHKDCASEPATGLDTFERRSRAGHTGKRLTLADKLKVKVIKIQCSIEGCDAVVAGSVSWDIGKTRTYFCAAHRQALAGTSL